MVWVIINAANLQPGRFAPITEIWDHRKFHRLAALLPEPENFRLPTPQGQYFCSAGYKTAETYCWLHKRCRLYRQGTQRFLSLFVPASWQQSNGNGANLPKNRA